jgi:DNA-binding LacI/PurR family transcriptional regulator
VGGRRDEGVDSMATLRTRGYRQAHARAAIAVDEQLIVEADTFTIRDGYEAVMRLHRQGVSFDGVFVLTDAAATGVLRALADLGRRVPGDVQVVGFDNDMEGEYLVPRLTTIDPDNDSMAARIIDLLLRRVEARAPRVGEAVEVVTSARLVVRESTRPRVAA